MGGFTQNPSPKHPKYSPRFPKPWPHQFQLKMTKFDPFPLIFGPFCTPPPKNHTTKKMQQKDKNHNGPAPLSLSAGRTGIKIRHWGGFGLVEDGALWLWQHPDTPHTFWTSAPAPWQRCGRFGSTQYSTGGPPHPHSRQRC